MKYGCIIKITEESLGRLLCSLPLEETEKFLAHICLKRLGIDMDMISAYQLWIDQKTDIYYLKLRSPTSCNGMLTVVPEGAEYPHQTMPF